MTRREFHFTLFAAVPALSVPSAGQEVEQNAEDMSPASINAWLPAPMPPEQARQVAKAGKALQKTLRAMRIRAEAMKAMVKVFETVDARMASTLLQGAPLVDRSLNETWVNMGGNGGFANLTGLPSIAVPMGLTASGLPLGLELIRCALRRGENQCPRTDFPVGDRLASTPTTRLKSTQAWRGGPQPVRLMFASATR